jgi:hypothetical protein
MITVEQRRIRPHAPLRQASMAGCNVWKVSADQPTMMSKSTRDSHNDGQTVGEAAV